MIPDENRESDIDPKFSNIQSSANTLSSFQEPESSIKSEKKVCAFPSAYSILLIIELIVFILTYIIPKGLYDKITYSSEENQFVIKSYNGTVTRLNATQAILDKYKVKIPLESFVKGYIQDPISIPDTYHSLDESFTNPLKVLIYPILGYIDSAKISFFLMVMGGCLNLLIEMEALSAGMAALSRVTKGREFLLLILVFIIIAIGGTTFGMAEETLAFYPILMPIFLKSGFDGMLAAAPLFMGSVIGNMFSTVNPFCVVLASYSAGITFTKGTVLRVILLVLVTTLGIIYLYIYYRRILVDEQKSVVYEIKDDIEKEFLKNKKENTEIQKIEEIKDNSEKKDGDQYVVEISEVKSDNLLSNNIDSRPSITKMEFVLKQKIAIIIFIAGFVIMVAGILIFDWWFEHMTAIFLVLGIVLMFLYNKGEKEGLECFLKGAGDFIGVTIVIGIARGINLTLNDGKISDTILNSLTNGIGDLPSLGFALIIFIIFIFLGIFIQSSSGLAILSMPVFAPLADKVQLSRVVVVNAYMWGEYLVAFITPTGLVLIVLSMAHIGYSYWVKFIWPFMLVLFILLIFFVLISSLVD